MLLHTLSSIIYLPVTRSIVKDSGLGKRVAVLGKHKLVVGTPNEAAVQERVQAIKDTWKAAVKMYKDEAVEEQSKPVSKSVGEKRPPSTETEPVVSKPIKKAKHESTKPSSKTSFSSLLKKASAASTSCSNGSSKTSTRAQSAGSDSRASTASQSQTSSATDKGTSKSSPSAPSEVGNDAQESSGKPKKSAKRVKWSDHFGRPLEATKGEDGVETTAVEHIADTSWNDRKKRDRLREKELLAKVK